MRSITRLALGATALASLACSQSADDVASGSRSFRGGDTLIVRTVGAGPWGPAHTPRIERVVTGLSTTQPFGLLDMIAATPDGGVVVLDRKASESESLLLFDSAGSFVRRIGRAGGGPGEYSRNLHMAGHLDVSPLGTIHVLDQTQQRVLVYDRRGEYLRSLDVRTRSPNNVLVATHDGGVCVSDNPTAQRTTGRAPIRCLDSLGVVVDSIADIEPWEPNAADDVDNVYSSWTVTRDRRVIHHRSDKLGFLLLEPNAARERTWSVVRLSDFAAKAVRRSRGEMEEERLFAAYAAQGRRQAPREVPANKPLSGRISTDVNGRVWIARRSKGEVIDPEMKFWSMTATGTPRELTTSFAEPTHMVVFDSLGTLLGELQFPIRTRVSAVGSVIWAAQITNDGESHLVKYRLPD